MKKRHGTTPEQASDDLAKFDGCRAVGPSMGQENDGLVSRLPAHRQPLDVAGQFRTAQRRVQTDEDQTAQSTTPRRLMSPSGQPDVGVRAVVVARNTHLELLRPLVPGLWCHGLRLRGDVSGQRNDLALYLDASERFEALVDLRLSVRIGNVKDLHVRESAQRSRDEPRRTRVRLGAAGSIAVLGGSSLPAVLQRFWRAGALVHTP